MPLGGLIPYDLNDRSVKLAQLFLRAGDIDSLPGRRTMPVKTMPVPTAPGTDEANGPPFYRIQPIEPKPFMPPGLTNENMAAFAGTPAGRAIIDAIIERISPQFNQPAVRAWRRYRAPR